MMKVYTYQKCSTCRKATEWLRARGITFEELPIKETPPAEEELEAMLGHYGGELRRLFNTSGMDYRALGLKDRLPVIPKAEAFELLRGNGMLVKRPFLLAPGVGLVGFNEAKWAQVLA